MRDVVIIGAGVLGASVAFRLAQKGCRVTVLEAARVGSGTSGCSFAWLNSNGKTPRAYHDLNVAGMQAHAELRSLFPDTPWLHGGGSLEITSGAEDGAALLARIDRLRGWGYAAEPIAAAALAKLEPELDLAAIATPTIGWFPDDGWIDPVLFAQYMIRAATGLGATLHIGAHVAGMDGTEGRITGVHTADGRHFVADMVVNCAGRWVNDAGTTMPIPLAPTAGFLAFTPPAPVTLGRVLRTALVDMRPDGAGRLMLHDNDIDRELTLDSPLSPDMPQAVRMVESAARLFPGLRGLRPEAVRIAVRPVPADGYSAIGPVPGKDGYYLAVTHSAVTMSAVLGKLIAGEIADGIEAPELALFRPARFFGANTPPIGGGAEALRHAG